jgi:hypothetical protein
LPAALLFLCCLALQVNFDPERFVEYITKADDFLELIRNKLAQAGVQGRPTAAQLPWFDLQVSCCVTCKRGACVLFSVWASCKANVNPRTAAYASKANAIRHSLQLDLTLLLCCLVPKE